MFGYILQSLYSSAVAYNDFNKNINQLENSKLIGGDKFFHCKANYEAARRGEQEAAMADWLSEGREKLQYIAHTTDIQDASDDMEANRRGRAGALLGKSLLESCPRNPREYYK